MSHCTYHRGASFYLRRFDYKSSNSTCCMSPICRFNSRFFYWKFTWRPSGACESFSIEPKEFPSDPSFDPEILVLAIGKGQIRPDLIRWSRSWSCTFRNRQLGHQDQSLRILYFYQGINWLDPRTLITTTPCSFIIVTPWKFSENQLDGIFFCLLYFSIFFSRIMIYAKF